METTPYTGYIDKTEFVKQSGMFDKIVVTLKMSDCQSCFIEFRSRKMMKAIKQFNVGDRVTITTRIEGKISASSGQKYNNIIAHNINLNN